MARKWIVVAGIVVALTAGACGGDPGDGEDATGADGNALEVTAVNFGFSPTTLEVEPGAEVELTFTNDDETQHSFTADDLDIDIVLDGGASESTTFTAPDSDVEWRCKFHETMTGTISTGATSTGGGGDDSGTGQGDDLDY
jgi:plastocyanin